MLFLGKTATKKQEGTLQQIRCHVNVLTNTMMSTVEVPNDDEKNFGSAESKLNNTKGNNNVKV